jgi:hypothetical protein
MSPTLLASAAIVIVSSLAFVAVGTVYRWDLSSPGYARWQQVIGVCGVLGIAGVAAYSRIDEPVVAGAVLLGGVVLAVGYAFLYRRLTARMIELTAPPDDVC